MPPNDPVAVPLCDLQASYQQLRGMIDSAISRVLESGQAIMGPEVAGLEREIADYCGAKFGVGCSSGSDALLLALAALGVSGGDEVVMPPFTFFATAGAVSRLGAIPVFVDIDPETCNIDPSLIEEKITPRTKAIIPVHLFGQCAEMEPIQRIAARHQIPIIEDAAQSFGSEYRGEKAGVLGTMACFSFYPTKTLGTFGDGGMVVTNDPQLAKMMACLRVHGMEPKYHHQELGWNARLDAIHAAILRVKLPHVESWIEDRQAAARRYDSLITRYGLDDFVDKPVVRPDLRHTFNQYVIRVAAESRDSLIRHLKTRHVGTEVYYPRPLHLQECMKYLGYREGDFPVSERAAREVLALPMFPEMTRAQQDHVVGSIAEFARGAMRRAA